MKVAILFVLLNVSAQAQVFPSGYRAFDQRERQQDREFNNSNRAATNPYSGKTERCEQKTTCDVWNNCKRVVECQ